MKTTELITLDSCTKLLSKYKVNWTRKGLNKYAKTIYCENGEDGIIQHRFSR